MWSFLKPIEIAFSYIFIYIHKILVILGFKDNTGISWIISIILLTIIIRLLILPLFFHTIKNSRKMQEIQPHIQALQKKYKNKKDTESRQNQAREMQELYKEHGANPMSSCLPVLLQAPFFLALYRTLSSIEKIANGSEKPIGLITQDVATTIENSSFFGIHLSNTFQNVQNGIQGQIVIGCLIACMCVSMFINTKIITQKNTPAITKESPAYGATKNMAYIMPLVYVFSGAVFPVGVLIYWFTTNLWTLGQGIVQIYFFPAPGSDAAADKEKRDNYKKEKEISELKASDPEKYNEIYKPDELKKQRKQPSKKKKQNK